MQMKMHHSFFHWIVAHPVSVLVITLLWVGACASGAGYLLFKTDYRVFFSKENPQLQAFDELERRYTKNDNVLFMLVPKSGEIYTPRTLQAVQELTEKSWQLPFSIRVDSLSNFQHTYADGDELVVTDLVGKETMLTPDNLKRIREVALNEPLLLHQLVSPDGTATAVNVTLQFPDNQDASHIPAVTAKAREMAAQIRQSYPDLQVYIAGMVLIDNAFSEASLIDTQTLVPLSLLVILLSLALLIRGWGATFAAFWVILLSIAGAMGAAGWLGIFITPPSASAPTMILTLAVSNAVHVLASYLHFLPENAGKRATMLESLRVNAQPVFLTSFTTILGFLSLNFSEAPPFRDLGNIVALGVFFSYVLAVTFLPAMMLLLPVRVRPQAPDKPSAMERYGAFVVRRYKPLLWGMLAMIAGLTAMAPLNELNDQFVHYFDKRVAFRADSDMVDAKLGGLDRIDYSLSSGEPGGIADPAFLRKVDAFAQWYRQQPETTHVNAFTDIVKRLNRNMHADDPAFYLLPQDRDLIAQYVLLYEMSLPKGLDLNDQINVDKSATRFSVSTVGLSTKQLLRLEQRAQDWLSVHMPEIQSPGTGPSIMFAYISQRNIKSMLFGSFAALVLISAVLIIALRSWTIGLISLLPNIVPAAMAFGIWALVVGEVGLSVSVIVGMTLGIVVDDTVHFLSKYLRARRELAYDSEQAVRYAFSTVGRALWITSVVLIGGFAVLALSTFKLNSGMGLLTAITIALALAADFVLLPALLLTFDRKRKYGTAKLAEFDVPVEAGRLTGETV